MQRTLVIGGMSLAIPFPISFAVLEEAWNGWEAMAASQNSVQFTSGACAFIAPVLRKAYPDLGTTEAVKEALLPSEMDAMGQAVLDVLRDNKIIDDEAKDAPAGEAPSQPEATG